MSLAINRKDTPWKQNQTESRNAKKSWQYHRVHWFSLVYMCTITIREKQYPRVMIRKIFLKKEFSLNIFISLGSLVTKLKLPLHWLKHLVNRIGALEYLSLARVIFSVIIHISPTYQCLPSLPLKHFLRWL